MEYVTYNGIKVSVEDCDLLMSRYWCALSNRSPRAGDRPTIYLHRLIADRIGLGDRINHRNGDPLDCCRSNLQTTTDLTSGMTQSLRPDNKSGVKGVSFRKGRRKCWLAVIVSDGIVHSLGSYASLADATLARQAGEEKYFDPNFPERANNEVC